MAHRAKLPSFRLFISPHFWCLSPHGGLSCFVPEPGQNIHLPLSKKKQAGLVQLSESSVKKLLKLGKSDCRQRSKTLNISSGLREPRQAVIFLCSPATRFGHLSDACQNAEEHADFHRNIILAIKCSFRRACCWLQIIAANR